MSQESIETILTVPFYPQLNKTPPYKRTPRAIRLLKEFIKKHTKADKIVLTNELNEYMWKRGIQKPPRKVMVRAIIETEDEIRVATVELIKEKVEVEARPELKGIALPGELEEEEEEEEEEEGMEQSPSANEEITSQNTNNS
ncbi:MAG: 50S ribosomal protein L31e [Candidatus Heimdallarchaeaceae archaeon]